MLKFYLVTIGLFYLSFALLVMRYFINKSKITLGKNQERWFTIIRLLVFGAIPIMNIFATMVYIYYSTLADTEKFIKMMNGKL